MSDAETPQAAPTRLGRYPITGVLGAGTMGIVYEAFDPELERVRAIKFMRPRPEATEARARFLREAKAMARLDHPNVVAVHDVGTHDERPFVVMDFVQGTTLRAWIARAHPDWRAVLDAFIAAGRGLSAAHDAGLVHRDFKPTNVLVGDDGTVKVTDFGLVRAEAEPAEAPPDETELAAATVVAGRGFHTRTGRLLGTPAYMAPEQFRGEPADAASDQFSFCVGLFEAVYGQHPFGGEEHVAALKADQRLRLREPDPGVAPPWLLEALRRGLSHDTGDRWPSMPDLLTALERGGGAAGRPAGAAWAFAVAVGLAAVGYAVADPMRAWLNPISLRIGVDEATIDPPMTLAADPDIGSFVSSAQANKGRARFDVQLPASGRYAVWGLAWEPVLGGDRGDADSFFVYVDDGEERLWHVGCQNEAADASVVPAAGQWRWQRMGHMPNADSDCVVEALTFELDAGPHRIVVRNREAAQRGGAVRLAAIVVTNVDGFQP